MDTDTVLTATKAPGLFFCPVCGKPSTQESSFTRHVQYCKRRAATKRTSRPKACRHCRATKSKCDAQFPCSRCTSRHRECIYDKPWSAPEIVGSQTTQAASVAASAPAPTEKEGGEAPSDTSAGYSNTSKTSSSVTTASASSSPVASDGTSLGGQSGDQESCCPCLTDAPPLSSSGNSTSTLELAVTLPSSLPTTLSTTTTTTTTAISTAPMTLDASSFDSGSNGMSNFLLPQNLSMYGINSYSDFGSGSLGPTSLGMTAPPMQSPYSMHLPYAPPPDPILAISDGLEESGASVELRRLITSMVRTFPRMMTRPGSMPPFIHRVGCGLQYDDVDVEGTFPPAIASMSSSSSSSTSSASSALSYRVPKSVAADATVTIPGSSQQTTLFTPLPFMAACVGISHAFVTRSANSDEFLWRSIDKEHQTIIQRMNTLSFGEIFVAIQAVSIYTTMRLIVYGREYFFSDTSLLDTMSHLSERFHELWQGPFMPVHDEDRDLIRAERPNWEDWIFDETRRRITVTCWLMSMAVNPRAQSFRLSRPHRFPLPSSRRLWEAETRAEWEREYDNDQFEKHILVQSANHANSNAKNGKTRTKLTKLTTVGDLARAIDRSVADEGSLGMPNNDALFEDDLLAYWHAGVDSLGMLVTAAAAQYSFKP